MKRLASVVAIMLLSVFVYTGAVHAGIGVRVWGGFNKIGYGDYNNWADAVNREILAGTGHAFENMNWVGEFGGEALVTVIPMLDIGVGVGMLLSSMEYDVSGDGVTYTQTHKVRSIPFTLTGYFKPPLPVSVVKPFVFGGVGLYSTKLTWDEDLNGTAADDFTYETELTKTGFGIHGGLGVEFSVLPMVSVDLNVKGRWAKIKGFEGTGTHSILGDMDVILVYDEEDLYYGPMESDNPNDYEEGEVDLSGLGFALGVKVMF